MSLLTDLKVSNKAGTTFTLTDPISVSQVLTYPAVTQYFDSTFSVGDSTNNLIQSNINGTLQILSLRLEGTGSDKYTISLKKNSTIMYKVRTSGDGTVTVDRTVGLYSATDDFYIDVDRTDGSGGTTIYMIIDYTIV